FIPGGVSRPGPVPAFLRSPAVLSPGLDLKPFLQFPLESPHPASIGLFPNFNTMDPVQKAVMTHTFGPPLLKTKRPIISCNVCQIRFNSESQAEAHYKGNRHARRVKGIETTKNGRIQDGDRQNPDASPPVFLIETSPLSPQMTVNAPPAQSPPALPPSARQVRSVPYLDLPLRPSLSPLWIPPQTSPSPAPSPSSAESEEEKAKKLLYCALCKVAVNSLSQLEAHNKGTKHKTILEARSGLGPIKAYPRLCPRTGPDQDPGSDPNSQERTFHCEICNVRVNSEMQLKQHISSRRHRDGVAGKPNPLLNRHKKRADFMELPKPLGPGLLPSPLAVAAAMAAAASSNQLALRPPGPAGHHHLLQGAPLSLLRPAPGPIRTAHGPILFTPY
uniref:C2H2-type domain-containing protein n=1 Tax=Periophthalmus magnuspinnatus TaxID=409849 RepID=A0A3B3ZYS4_9GOBI